MGGLLHQTKEPDILFGARRVPDLQSVTGSLIQTGGLAEYLSEARCNGLLMVSRVFRNIPFKIGQIFFKLPLHLGFFTFI